MEKKRINLCNKYQTMIDLGSKGKVESFIIHILNTWSAHCETYVKEMSDFFDESFREFGTAQVMA